MSLLAELRSFAGLTFGLPSFFRHTVTLDEARDVLRRRVEQREDNFLRTIERGIFGHRSSPYRPLLALAGCEFGDVRAMVRSRGLEPTLRQLRDQGVYVSFEEFKGREPMIRGGREIAVKPSDFLNPYAQHHFWTETGGTTGPGIRSSTGLPRLLDLALYYKVAYDAYGMAGAPKALWRGTLPDGSGLGFVMASARAGEIADRWFTPLTRTELTSSRKYPMAASALMATARLCGVSLPRPQPVGLDRADIVAHWAADALRAHRRCYISASASMALRVCLAAKAEGLDLTGTTFSGGGEPMTAAKAQGIAAVGARSLPNYFTVDTGVMGMSCASPAHLSEQHLFKDSVALTQYTRQVPGTAIEVEAFNVTTVLPSAQKLLLNVDLDDFGVVEHRSCGCPFEALGFTDHLHHIASWRKLTGEGVTLVGTDMVRILEEVLPSRFGGSALDYQLAEEEDAQGFTRLSLLVGSGVPAADESAMRDAVLRALAASSAGADYARAIWQKAGTLRVKRADPVWTARGKLLPLRIAARMKDS
ncbi:MAG: hypothetical protein ACRD2N_00220 [Vicinamibacterales bacterium]